MSGLSSGTYYHFRAVSSGTPVIISFEQSDRTFSDAVLGGVSDGRGNYDGGGNPVMNFSPANPPAPAFVQGEVAGIETEVVETTPTPTFAPQVEGVLTDTFEIPSGFNWWFLIIPVGFLFAFLLWLARRTRN